MNLGPKKKLLVMNINRLLLYRARQREIENIHKYRTSDALYAHYFVFFRPFSQEFMKFCLERFEVGIWSSAMERNVDTALNYAIGSLRNKLLFVWDQKKCTDSGFRSKENKHKPLLYKELKKVFQDVKKGDPKGELCSYLKGVAAAQDVQSFVKQNPFDPKGELCSYLKEVAAAQDVQSFVKENPLASSYYSAENSDSEDDYEDVQDMEKEIHRLDKLNFGPRKKLLVINLNRLLVNKIHRHDLKEIPNSRPHDAMSEMFFVFKRPFVEEFMKFCLDRFEVGIWSSAMEHNIDPSLNCIIGSLKSKLLFVWDQGQCLDSGFNALERESRPIFFKELKKVWEKVKKGGPYTASNTLLIDDKPYKAFLNPPNTAIFPKAYKIEDKDDKTLDPKGELCLYLEGLANANDVQSFVKENPFGQPAITSSHPDWDYYSKPNTTIFPKAYKIEDKDDKTLDPKGELCLYLEGLANANDVQSYVNENPFGQPAITSSHPDWDNYSSVEESLRRRGYR
ncbi:hypothetical protein RIF29_39813 [Crotalaria pallida]|uniref:Mitochondrial import inner membrane translocase subunit TIM50 n=1 Tax=Crotalaria pallida TaxID=3830 RepID=A0AAN9E1W0_CROPI